MSVDSTNDRLCSIVGFTMEKYLCISQSTNFKNPSCARVSCSQLGLKHQKRDCKGFKPDKVRAD